MKKFGMIIVATIMAIILSGCDGATVKLPFMEENPEHHYTVSQDGDIIGAIDANWTDNEWEVTITDIQENDEELGFTWEGKKYLYQDVSSSETIRMDEETFEAFIDCCTSDDSISLKEY